MSFLLDTICAFTHTEVWLEDFNIVDSEHVVHKGPRLVEIMRVDRKQWEGSRCKL